MIPLRDSTPSDSFPLVTVAIIIANLLIFASQTVSGDQLIYILGLIPAIVTRNHNYISLFTSMFLHGSWMHVIGNMWILWLFGDNLEDKMGRIKFFIFYIICGLIAAISHYLINPYSQLPVVGASGAVAGVMGAYFLMFRKAKVLTFIPPFFLLNLPAWIFLGFWALSQLWQGTTELLSRYNSGQIAFWAHIGGFLAGMILYKYFLKEPTSHVY